MDRLRRRRDPSHGGHGADKIAIFYATQKKWDQAREATTRANAIRTYLLADGLSGEASQRIDEGKLAEARRFTSGP